MLLNKANPGLAESLGLDLGDSLEIRVSALASEQIEQITAYLESFLDVYNSPTSSFIAQLPLEIKVVKLCLGETASVLNSQNVKPVGTSSLAKKITVEKKVDSPISKTESTAPFLTAANDFSQAEVLEKWTEFLTRLKSANHSLSFILQNCQVGCISGGKF